MVAADSAARRTDCHVDQVGLKQVVFNRVHLDLLNVSSRMRIHLNMISRMRIHLNMSTRVRNHLSHWVTWKAFRIFWLTKVVLFGCLLTLKERNSTIFSKSKMWGKRNAKDRILMGSTVRPLKGKFGFYLKIPWSI